MPKKNDSKDQKNCVEKGSEKPYCPFGQDTNSIFNLATFSQANTDKELVEQPERYLKIQRKGQNEESTRPKK